VPARLKANNDDQLSGNPSSIICWTIFPLFCRYASLELWVATLTLAAVDPGLSASLLVGIRLVVPMLAHARNARPKVSDSGAVHDCFIVGEEGLP
jgi:hypothetical protein